MGNPQPTSIDDWIQVECPLFARPNVSLTGATLIRQGLVETELEPKKGTLHRELRHNDGSERYRMRLGSHDTTGRDGAAADARSKWPIGRCHAARRYMNSWQQQRRPSFSPPCKISPFRLRHALHHQHLTILCPCVCIRPLCFNPHHTSTLASHRRLLHHIAVLINKVSVLAAHRRISVLGVHSLDSWWCILGLRDFFCWRFFSA